MLTNKHRWSKQCELTDVCF